MLRCPALVGDRPKQKSPPPSRVSYRALARNSSSPCSPWRFFAFIYEVVTPLSSWRFRCSLKTLRHGVRLPSDLHIQLLGIWREVRSSASRSSGEGGFKWGVFISGWWLTCPSEKYESAGMIIPNCMESHKIPWFQSPPTRYLYKTSMLEGLVSFLEVHPHVDWCVTKRLAKVGATKKLPQC